MTMVAPGLHQAVRFYGDWRAANFSLNTWAGEAPGLLNFADFCADHPQGPYVRFDQLTDLVIDDWWAYTRERLAPATQTTRLHQLRSFFGYAIQRGWLDSDPTLLLRSPRPAPEIRERLAARELLDLLGHAKFPQHRIILALASNLALRQSEIKSLTIGDYNPAALTLRVRIHKTRKVDDMPVSLDLARELADWLDHYRALTPGLTQQSHLVPSMHYTGVHKKITYRPDRSIGDPEDVVKVALTRMGWETVKGEGIHTIRRSVARIFFDAAEAEESYHEALLGTMRLLHHDKPETTLRYIGVDRQTRARDEFLRGKPFLSRLAAQPTLTAVSA